jgi:hypothetical protein
VALAEKQADLDAQTDSDPNTNATGVTLNVTAVSLDIFQLDETTTLENAVARVVDLTHLHLDQNFERPNPVLGHRAIVIVGSAPGGRYSTTAIWMQDGILTFASMGTPNQQTNNDLAMSFDDFLATFVPLNPLDLDAPVVLNPVPGYSMRFPKGWTLVPDDPLELYQNLQDQTAPNGKISGVALLLIHASVGDFQSQLGLDRVPTLADLMAFLVSNTALQEPVRTSYLKLFDQPALGALGQSSTGTWGRTVVGTVGSEVYVFIIAAPDEQTMTTFQPTWIAMLQSIHAV